MLNSYPKCLEVTEHNDLGGWDIEKHFHILKNIITTKHPTADFMNGQCMLFALELKARFSHATLLINNDHVLTLIKGATWDYTGRVWFAPHNEPKLYFNALERTEEFLNATT